MGELVVYAVISAFQVFSVSLDQLFSFIMFEFGDDGLWAFVCGISGANAVNTVECYFLYGV